MVAHGFEELDLEGPGIVDTCQPSQGFHNPSRPWWLIVDIAEDDVVGSLGPEPFQTLIPIQTSFAEFVIPGVTERTDREMGALEARRIRFVGRPPEGLGIVWHLSLSPCARHDEHSLG